VVIPPKSAGIGHSGMIGLVDGRFLGVWNITPATSVSIVDVAETRFVGEISTPGCAGVYPVGRGFLMPCGDGALLHVMLAADGTEAGRTRSEEFFDVSEDPVYDYALPGPDGWVFVSFDGRVFEADVDGADVTVEGGWSIFGTDARMAEDEDGWRIGGRQPFAVSATGLFATLMHEGGGQETFEDPGTAIWVYDLERRRKGFVIELEDDLEASSIAFTNDDEPLLVVIASDEVVQIRDGATGRLLRTMGEMGVSLMQPLE
jgi:methylamine dehydrogenase heavy chain